MLLGDGLREKRMRNNKRPKSPGLTFISLGLFDDEGSILGEIKGMFYALLEGVFLNVLLFERIDNILLFNLRA